LTTLHCQQSVGITNNTIDVARNSSIEFILCGLAYYLLGQAAGNRIKILFLANGKLIDGLID